MQDSNAPSITLRGRRILCRSDELVIVVKESSYTTMIITMIFTMHMPYAFALGEPWEGTAKGDVLIQDTVTKIADQVYEHEVITNNENGNNQRVDYLLEVGKSSNIKIVAGYGENDTSSWSLTPTTKQAAAYEADHPGGNCSCRYKWGLF